MLESMRQLGTAFLMYWKDRRERWVTRHTDLLRRLRKVYITLAWIFIPLAILAAIFFPQVKEAFTQFLWSYYLLWQFWFLSRSKTLTWTGMARFFAVGAWIIAPLSALLLYGVHTLFAEGSATIQADWSSVVVGPITEETIKLLPFLLIFCFTRRSQTFSLTDYMLVGGATGVGFDFMEEMVRRWVATDSGGLIGYFFRLFSESDDSWQVFTLFPGTNESGGAISVDHGVWTAFVTLAIGISIRMKNRWGKKGFLFPLFVYLWATFDHSSWNDQNPGPWKDLLHTLLGQGHFYLWSFVIVLLVAVWMDFRRLNLVRHQLPLLPKEQVIEPIFELLTIIQSLFRGRQAWGHMMLFTRERRHYGFTLLQEKDELFPNLGDLRVSLQQRFLFLGGVFATLLVLGLSSSLLSHFTITDAYFAGLFDQLSDWWQGLNGWEKGGIIAGTAVIGGVLTVATGGGFLAGGMTALGAALTANDVLQSPIPMKSFMNDPMGATKQWTRELLKKPPQEAVNTVFTLAADQLLRRVPALRAGNELMDSLKSRVQRSARNWMPGRSVVDAGTGMRMRADWDRHDWNEPDYRESRGSGSEVAFQAKKPPSLKPGDPNYTFRTEIDPETGEMKAYGSDGRTYKVYHADKANLVLEKTTPSGKTYRVPYDQDAAPDFTSYALKAKDGKLVEITLPADSLVGKSGEQTRYTTQLFKEQYPNWKEDFDFTESQIEAIEKNKGSIGPGVKANPDEQLTWHHDKATGKMILVPYELNNSFPHTGGHSHWGKQIYRGR